MTTTTSPATYGDLHRYVDGRYLRPATQAERDASRAAGPEGVIRTTHEGQTVDAYVQE